VSAAAAPTVASPAPPAPSPPIPSKKLPDADLLAREAIVKNSYLKAIQRKVYEQHIYPRQAVIKKWEGQTKVGIHLAADGNVIDVVVEEKSDYPVLDEAALKMVKGLKPFPPLPDELRGKERTIIVPVQFTLPANS
jgi:TonB family protein